ncbi:MULTISPECIES: mechanosensitive ion channel family protein [Saliphagus]|uniref:Mechanosensitive ion channel family protein n=1 Tax=Saliphagus infecundisoli TaxID=1849069 RepID=A0ABD5Q9J9_9EURY|nr:MULTISPECIES: mechanosensitive ion channel family protein [Saliphagus]
MTDATATTRVERLLAEYVALADSVAVFALTFLALYVLGRGLVALADRWMEFRRTDPTLRRGAGKALSLAVVAVAVLLALSTAGFEYALQRSAILVAALTVALGFAAQDVIGNLVSGAFIVTDPTFNIGDWIRWDDEEGVIEDISFRATRVRTFDNEVVTVPNSVLTNSAVTNPVLNDTLRLEVAVETGYDDVGEAVGIMREEADAHTEILDDPKPTVLITDLGETVRLSARIWIAEPNRLTFARVRSEYAEAVVERFEESGIDLGRSNARVLEGEVGVVPKAIDFNRQ